MTIPDNDRLKLYFVLEGQVIVESDHVPVELRMGDSFVIPGSLNRYTLRNTSVSPAKVLQMYVPKG